MYLTGGSKVWRKRSSAVMASFQEGSFAWPGRDRTGGRQGNSLPLLRGCCTRVADQLVF